jgi:hypothetical protein
MSKADGLYKQYKQEFKALEQSGCSLYCPEGVKVRPKQLAAAMVRDNSATYMRDMVYDGRGKVVRVNFTRVPEEDL